MSYTSTLKPLTEEEFARLKEVFRKACMSGLRPKSSTYGMTSDPVPSVVRVDCPCGKHQIDASADPQIAHREHYYGKDGVLGPQSNLDWAKPVGASARVELVPQADDMYEP